MYGPSIESLTETKTMLKKFAFAAFAAVPALVISSCSPSVESTSDDVKDVLVEIAEILDDNKNESIEDIIDELNDYIADVTPDLVETIAELSPQDRAAVVASLKDCEEFKKFQTAAAGLQSNPQVMKIAGTAMMGDTSAVTEIPLETKLQMVDIVANLVKIAVAFGPDNPEVQKAMKEVL